MGLNLVRERFADWVGDSGSDSRAYFLKRLEKHIGHKIDLDEFQVVDQEFPRVGSYTSYGIFRFCLQFVTKGDYGSELNEDDDIEWDALKAFRVELTPKSIKIPSATHFLNTGDTDTIFIPVAFAQPFVHDERFVASLPGAVKALQAFAKGLSFTLEEDYEDEYAVENGRWLPVATAKNVARIMHGFFTEKPNACVAFS